MKTVSSVAMSAGRIAAFGLGLVAMAALLVLLVPRPAEAATTYIVNKTGDAKDRKINGVCDSSRENGKQCTLRAAIQEANATPGGNSIAFNVGGTTPVKTIKPGSPLPTITDPVTIDGYTQPGALRSGVSILRPDAVLLIELNGTNAGAGANGLTIASAGSTIDGLVINRFDGNGIAMQGSGATNNEVLGSFIGTNAAGTAELGNGNNGVRSSADDNSIGGTVSAARNIISGNHDDGVDLGGATGNEVLGNFIGTNVSGTAGLGNTRAGVAIFSTSSGNTIGGTEASERNVISGNESDGVEISGSTATGNQVLGNFIGTDRNGTADLGNADDGVDISSSAQNNTVGGTAAEAGNVISGNGDDGIEMRNGALDNTVLGNLIGTNAAGTSALANSDNGVDISDADDNTVGGTVSGARNIISGNQGDGVVLFGTGATGNEVLGNFIGTDKNGTGALGNSDGVVISSANDNTIGGTASGAGNRIAHNEGDGALVVGGGAVGNRVLSNSIFQNGELGIDLGPEGVTANDDDDSDASGSSNRLQNFPEISSAIRSNTTNLTTITGTLNSNPSKSFTVQCFVTETPPDPSGHGEGQFPAGADTTVTTDSGGDASFACVSPVPQAGQTVTATATNTATGDSSEFALNQTVFPGP